MKQTGKGLFREKTLKKATEPEMLDGYLKVTGFGPWFVLIAAALVLAAIFVWTIFGRLQTMVTGAGYCENNTLLCYVAQNEIGRITEETPADIDGTEGKIIKIGQSLYIASEIPSEVLFLLPDSRWYCTVELDCPLDNGLYTVNFSGESLTPASFLTVGDKSQ